MLQAVQAGQSASRRLRILVVGVDGLDPSTVAADLVRSWGYCVERAKTARAALEIVDAFRPRVVILDVSLPDMHGYELARQIRHKAGGRKTHFVVITGWMQIADQLSSNAVGIAHHLVKPVPHQLVREILAAYQSTEEPTASATS